MNTVSGESGDGITYLRFRGWSGLGRRDDTAGNEGKVLAGSVRFQSGLGMAAHGSGKRWG